MRIWLQRHKQRLEGRKCDRMAITLLDGLCKPSVVTLRDSRRANNSVIYMQGLNDNMGLNNLVNFLK